MPQRDVAGVVRTALEVLVLVAYVALLVGGVASWLDLPITDDAGYWGAGQRLACGDASEWRLDWSPLYVAAYAALERLPLPGHRMDWMHALCVLGSTLALWWALRARCPAYVALPLAGFWALLDLPLRDTGRAYVFDMMLWSLAAGCFLRRRHLCALAVMMLAAIDRRETGLWLLALALVAVRWRHLLPRWKRWSFVAVAAGVLVLPPLLAGGDRLWLAFSQHYALGAAKRRADPPPPGTRGRSVGLPRSDPTRRVSDRVDDRGCSARESRRARRSRRAQPPGSARCRRRSILQAAARATGRAHRVAGAAGRRIGVLGLAPHTRRRFR